jgi:hypothetical protein
MISRKFAPIHLIIALRMHSVSVQKQGEDIVVLNKGGVPQRQEL